MPSLSPRSHPGPRGLPYHLPLDTAHLSCAVLSTRLAECQFHIMSSESSDEDAPSSEGGLSDEQLVSATLRESVDAVHTSGSFAVSQVADAFPPPELQIDGVDAVQVPLSSAGVQTLLAVGEKAPFGKGQQTLYDDSIRKTLQIDGSRISFGNDAWLRWLKGVITFVAEGLGVANGAENVRADLYKMLLYDQGAMFKPHRE